MRAAIAADLSTSRWDSIAVDTISVRANVAGGLATIQRLYAYGAHTAARVSGTFGLTRTTTGTLTYDVAVDSLGAFNRWIPKTPGSAAPVQPRPGVIAAATRRARADSIRVARATEMERAINGRPGPKLVVNPPKAVPADTLSGQVFARGTMHGNLYDFDLRGRAGGQNVVARGNAVHAFAAIYDWTNARSSRSKLVLAVDADSVSAMGFAFDTASLRLTYASPGGHVELAVRQGDRREYGARGDYALYPDRKELQLADMTFRFDTTYWSMPHPAMVAWGGPGIRVDHFELRNRGEGRIYANGLLPTSGVADFTLDVDQFPIGNIADIVQSDVDVTGVLMLHGSMKGTLSNPAFRGAFALVAGTYNGQALPDLRGNFGYADRQLVSHVDALQNSSRLIATADARLPLNLAFTGVTGSRLLPEPMSVDVVADSLPLELIPQFTDLVSNFHGRAAAHVAMRGTLSRPSLVGAVVLDHGSVTLNQTGATIGNIAASIRMANDTVYVDSIAGSAKGDVHVRGTLAVGNWREPAFNLFLVSHGAELLNNDWGKIRIDAGLALTGPFQSAYLSGALTVVQGVIYAPEPTGRHMIGAGDPALFNVLDTAVTADRDMFPPASPLIGNMRMDVALGVNHDVWVRNREANVEIYTDEPLSIHELAQSFAITGIVNSDRGEYNFLSKRFQITRGSAMFIGTPDINPTLQLTGEYQVQLASRGALNIRVLIGGTLKKPKLSLESDAQPPKTQSELLSLLAFGQSSTTLLTSGSSSVAGSAATMDLFGVGAQVAVRRLASVALGVAVDQVQVQTGRALGLDVFDITPADVPDVSGKAIGNFLTQTKFEAGKYVNPRTFVTAQEQAGRPGFGVEHRTQDGWRFTATFEPQILLREPNLNEPNWQIRRTIGGFVIREWKF
jgi:translocation and assembly module TamB